MSIESERAGDASGDVSASAGRAISFDNADDRTGAMFDEIENLVERLAAATEEAAHSEEFETWLDSMSQFHDYSWRNRLLIKMQLPQATKVAGFWAWKNEFNRSVKKGESGAKILVPAFTGKMCADCGCTPEYDPEAGEKRDDREPSENHADCTYSLPPEEWQEGVVSWKVGTVFDVSQTEGEPLPELDTDAAGEASGLFDAVKRAAENDGYPVEQVAPDEWAEGSANGVCKISRTEDDAVPEIKIQDREPVAAKTSTLIHEYAHAAAHLDRGADDDSDKVAREVEAEAVAYVIGERYGLDMSGSAFYLASWAGDDTATIHSRLRRIASISTELINRIDDLR